MEQQNQRGYNQLRFSEVDLKAPHELASKLYHAPDAASKHIQSVLGAATLRRLEPHLDITSPDPDITNPEAPWPAPAALKDLLVELLNSLLSCPALYHPQAFARLTLPEELLGAGDQYLVPLGDKLARRNRLLLQAAYHDELAPYPTPLEEPPHYRAVTGDNNVSFFERITDSVIFIDKSNSDTGGADWLQLLSEFEVKDSEKEELMSSFVSPLGYRDIARQVSSHRLIWIIGPPEAGKSSLALHLAQTECSFQSIYKIQGARAWDIISESSVKNSVVVLTDPVYLAKSAGEIDPAPSDLEALDESELEDEELAAAAEAETATAEVDLELSAAEPETLSTEDTESEEPEDGEPEFLVHPIKGFLERGNTLIITSTKEIFEKVRDQDQSASLGGTDT